MFDFTFKCFAEGFAVIPKFGMEEIPKQIVAQLPNDSIILNEPVSRVDGKSIHLKNGEIIDAVAVILATEANSKLKEGYGFDTNNHRSTETLYFITEHQPYHLPILSLNGSVGIVNHVAVMSNISEAYAPRGMSLIAVSLRSNRPENDVALANMVINELYDWYGTEVNEWKMLKRYRIMYALPDQDSVSFEQSQYTFHLSDGVFAAGDHLLNGSINGALKSGRLTAKGVLDYLTT